MKIKCKSIPERFRRAGMVFSNSPAEYDVDERTLKVLRSEPMLVIEVLPEEKKEPEKEKAPDKEKTSASQDQAGKKDKDKK
jgi:hypothetical protein